MRRTTTTVLSLAAHTGPEFDHWRAQVAASVGARLLDDAAGKP